MRKLVQRSCRQALRVILQPGVSCPSHPVPLLLMTSADASRAQRQRNLTWAPLARARDSKVSASPGFPSDAASPPPPPAAGCAARVARSASLRHRRCIASFASLRITAVGTTSLSGMHLDFTRRVAAHHRVFLFPLEASFVKLSSLLERAHSPRSIGGGAQSQASARRIWPRVGFKP